jgi:diguanylate cyclase (GGDEF)-like protein
VLIAMTHNIQSCLRRGDMLTRWGGEEFLLIMPNTDLEQAVQALERLRGHGLGVRPEGAPVTASIGVAERLGDVLDDWRTLVELADHRMYYAKQHGRNQVCAALPDGQDPLVKAA